VIASCGQDRRVVIWTCREGAATWTPRYVFTDPDPDPDPAIFVLDLQDANKKQFFSKFFFLLIFKVHLHHFS
jgi:hypothetical protein